MKLCTNGLMVVLVLILAGLTGGCQSQKMAPESAAQQPGPPLTLEQAHVVLNDFGAAARAGDLAKSRSLCYGTEAAQELLKAFVEVQKSFNEFAVELGKSDPNYQRVADEVDPVAGYSVYFLGGPEAAALARGAYENYGKSERDLILKPDGNRNITVIYDRSRLCRMAVREGQWKVELESGERPVSAKNHAIMLAAFRQEVRINGQLLGSIKSEKMTAEQVTALYSKAHEDSPDMMRLNDAIHATGMGDW